MRIGDMRRRIVWGMLLLVCLCVAGWEVPVRALGSGSDGSVQPEDGMFRRWESADGIFYYVEKQDGVAVIEVTAKKKLLTLPEQVDGKQVTSLGLEKEDGSHYFFDLKGKARRLVIPDCVKELVDPSIPNTLQTIRLGKETRIVWKAGPLLNGERLKSIEVSGKNPYYRSVDGVLYSRDGKILYAYPQNRSRKKYVLPASTREIFPFAFYCAGVRRVALNKKLRVIGDHAFHSCQLESLSLPGKLQAIGDYAFFYNWLNGTVEIPASVKTVGTGAFLNCDDVEEWRIQGSQTKLFTCAMGYSVYRSSDHGKNGLTVRVKSLKKPVLQVAAGSRAAAYAKKNGLRHVTAAGKKGGNGNITAFHQKKCRLTFREASEEKTRTELVRDWKSENGVYHYVMDQKGIVSIRSVDDAKGRLVIPEQIAGGTVTVLGGENWIFFTNDAVTELVLPDTVEEWHGFGYGPASVRLGKKTKLYVFDSYEGMTSLWVPEENPYYVVEDQVLYSKDHSILYKFFDRNAVSYTVHPDTKEIASSAFADAPAISEVTLPEGLLRIGDSAFYRVPLSSIQFPDSLAYIGRYAFDRVPLKGKVTIPAGVAEIGDYAFVGCSGVTEWEIVPERVKLGHCAIGYRFGSYYMDDMFRIFSEKKTRLTAGKKSTAYAYAKKNGLRCYDRTGKKLLDYKKVRHLVFDE